MNNFATAVLLALLCSGALASPRILKHTTADFVEHQRILEELETVSQLRERMLQEGVGSAFVQAWTLSHFAHQHAQQHTPS